MSANGSNTKQLGYLCTNIDHIYLSKQGLGEMGLIDQNFPHVAGINVNRDKVVDGCSCSCLVRPEKPPEKLSAVPDGIRNSPELMEKYLLQHYVSTVFNTCECQLCLV